MLSENDKQTAINNFKIEVENLLNPNNEDDIKTSNSLFLHIRKLLKQFRITIIDEKEVFSEAYLRSIEYIKKNNGEKIKNPAGLIRIIALNYIKETSRKQKKYLVYDPHILEKRQEFKSEVKESFKEHLSQEQLNLFYSFLNNLPWLEKKIIVLWKIKQMKWKEIVNEIKRDGETLSSVNARKRGERIFKKMKAEINKKQKRKQKQKQ